MRSVSRGARRSGTAAADQRENSLILLEIALPFDYRARKKRYCPRGTYSLVRHADTTNLHVFRSRSMCLSMAAHDGWNGLPFAFAISSRVGESQDTLIALRFCELRFSPGDRREPIKSKFVEPSLLFCCFYWSMIRELAMMPSLKNLESWIILDSFLLI